MEGDSLGGCAVQKQLQIQERGGTPEQPDAKDWRPKQSQDAGETNYQCMERQHGGEEKSKAEPNCRYTCLQEMTKPEVRWKVSLQFTQTQLQVNTSIINRSS